MLTVTGCVGVSYLEGAIPEIKRCMTAPVLPGECWLHGTSLSIQLQRTHFSVIALRVFGFFL